MKTFTIGWLNKCRCGNKSHTVKTARGNESALWDDDAVKCNSCGRGGVIEVYEGQARVLWETDEEMAEGKPMSTITKERVTGIARGEKCYTHDDVVELARIALASLEAEAVAWLIKFEQIGHSSNNFTKTYFDKGEKDRWVDLHKKSGFNVDVTPLHSAPPAPVVPDMKELVAILDWILMLPCPTPKATLMAKRLAVLIDTCRAAMLNQEKGNG